jgi:hypothetical protein
MVSEAAEPDQKDERDEEIMVGAPHLPRPAEQQQQCGKGARRKDPLLAAFSGSANSASFDPRSQ